MATATDFADRNDWIGKPPDMTDEQCYALPVCRIVTFIPVPTAEEAPVLALAHVSCWRLTEEEREEVARTGLVYLRILGASLPPLSVFGYSPINEEGEWGDHILTQEELNRLKGK